MVIYCTILKLSYLILYGDNPLAQDHKDIPTPVFLGTRKTHLSDQVIRYQLQDGSLQTHMLEYFQLIFPRPLLGLPCWVSLVRENPQRKLSSISLVLLELLMMERMFSFTSTSTST